MILIQEELPFHFLRMLTVQHWDIARITLHNSDESENLTLNETMIDSVSLSTIVLKLSLDELNTVKVSKGPGNL